ncbi:MAG TPA: class 1 fructose-bisphosphatase [Aliidongia sp.]|nr:class 1 fructose-bisphosphatase [Aliidongia sp.]
MMPARDDLPTYLDRFAGDDLLRRDLAAVVNALAQTGMAIRDLVGLGPLAGRLGAIRGTNADGDSQTELDVVAQDWLIEALRKVPVAVIASEELEEPLMLDPSAPFAVAFDPLDGSSNIDVNMPIGTIFSIQPMIRAGIADPLAPFMQTGEAQVAAGCIIYGPQTVLALTVGAGTQIFTFDYGTRSFRLTGADVRIPRATREYAINASNARHWDDPVRVYVEDCLQGIEGPRAKDFNTRWMGALVAETYRILSRGGLFLYPADARQGYREGRLRLIYEANPVAFLIEQAGGGATTGSDPIRSLVPRALHQRVPLIFGSAEEVERIEELHLQPYAVGERSPLFRRRGLFHH